MLSRFQQIWDFYKLDMLNGDIYHVAMDDTQRMMQMGGFGFDPTKVIT